MIQNKLLLLAKRHRDTLLEQTKTKPQQALESQLNKQEGIFPIISPVSFSEERKRLLIVTNVEAMKCVFKRIVENISFSILKPIQ